MLRKVLALQHRTHHFVSRALDFVDESSLKNRGQRGERVNLYDLGDSVWLTQFRHSREYALCCQFSHLPCRFTRDEVHQLATVLDLPERIRCPTSRISEDRVTALCMLLRRLAYPSRLADVQMQFGWERTRFSRIVNLTATFLQQRWGHLLFFDPNRLTREKLAEFARVNRDFGCPLDVVVGFIDGTLQEVARPVANQRLIYNGWKRMHCLKYHAVVTPDGIIIHLHGPVEGRRHDQTVFKESRLQDILDKHFLCPDGKTKLYLYGDSGYSLGEHILCPYKGVSLTPEEKKWNYMMSRARESVEWIFKEISTHFQFLDFPGGQKVLLSPCGLYYLVATLFCNAHTILHHPQIPQYFHCNPPTLLEYFNRGTEREEMSG